MRYGRLNSIRINSAVTKTCIVYEKIRPEKLRVEKWAIEEAASQGVRVPEIESYHRDHRNREVLVMERIMGATLTSRVSTMSCQAFHDIGRQLGNLPRKYPRFGWIDSQTMMGTYSSWAGFLTDYTTYYGRQLETKGLLDDDRLAVILRSIENESSLDQPKSALVHRDLKPGNIIVNESGPYLIDWENVVLGDPEFDLAIYVARFGQGSHWNNLLAGFGEINKQLNPLYQIIALIGLIDFCVTYKYGVTQKTLKLSGLITRLEDRTLCD